MTVSMEERVLLLSLIVFQRKLVNVQLTLVVQIVALTCAQASSVVTELVWVEIVNVIQIIPKSEILVNKHVHHYRVRPEYILIIYVQQSNVCSSYCLYSWSLSTNSLFHTVRTNKKRYTSMATGIYKMKWFHRRKSPYLPFQGKI